MLIFLLYTKLPKGRRCTADVWMQINRFSCNAVFLPLHLCISIICSFSSVQLFCASASLPRCVCVSSFQRSSALCVYTGSVSFSGSTGGDNLSTLPSQQGSSINKKAVPRCTIMANNKLPSLDLPSRSHSSLPHVTMWMHAYAIVYVYLTVSRCA